MKVYPDKLDDHLQSRLAPVYLLHGDEPLQIMEAGDRIRERARSDGFEERTVMQPTDDADWAAFRESADSLSLFAERRIIELRLPSGKPGRTGADVLKMYCASAPEDILLIISAGKLERSGANSAWFKAIDKVGVCLQALPIPPVKLGAWVKARLARHALRAEQDALALIVERVEGNLLAAQQEVERLALLYPEGVLTAQQVMDAVADSARYSIGDLVQAAMNGQARRAQRILTGLHDEAVADVLILWAIANEVRAAARTCEAHEAGVAMDSALKSAGVWQSRAAPLKKAMSRHDARSWLSMLSACSHIDRQIKGQAAGSVNDSLASLIVQLSCRGERIMENSNIHIP